MAVFIELVTSAINKGLDGSWGGKTRVRRPLRGLEIKDDTYAYIKMIGADGKNIDLVDSSAETGLSKEYSNFILQSVQEQRAERQQIVETFGDTYMFLFGESPRMLQVQAILINSLDFNWTAEFQHNYDNYLRGTKSLEKGARTYLFYDDNVVEGYIINCAMSSSSGEPLMVQLQFQFFVTGHRNISLVDTSTINKYPIRPSTPMAGADLRKTLDDPQLRSLVAMSVGTQESGFANQGIARTRPLRGNISDNSDEFTTPIQVNPPSPNTSKNFYNRNELKKDVRDLANAVGALAEAAGVPRSRARNPFTANALGLGPTFMPGGVGMGYGGATQGSYATFGAVAMAGVGGGFAGMGRGIGAVSGAGFGSFAGNYAGVGVGVGARAGFFAGSFSSPYGAYPSQQSAFANTRTANGIPNMYGGGNFGSYGTSTPLFGGMTQAEMAYVAATGDIFGFSASMGRAGGQQAAYAYSNGLAGFNNRGYTYQQMQYASRAGGYAGAGSYMGYPGYYSYAGASQSGAYGYGAAMEVGGRASVFSFGSLPGTFSSAGFYAQASYSF